MIETGMDSGKNAAGPVEDNSAVPDWIFDRAVEINLRNSVGVKSVSNIRQLGGYATADGKIMAPGVLFRSSGLRALTEEDAAKLKHLGVNMIVDLRTEAEVKSAPDINLETFYRIFCPLPALNPSAYRDSMEEKYMAATESKKKAYYLSEYISEVDMRRMYTDVLTDASSLASLRGVFSTFLNPGSGGILFHCTSGKDRTGIVAALLMFALGVGREDIKLEYYASAVSLFSQSEQMTQSLRKQGYSAAVIDQTRYFSGIGVSIAERVFEVMLAEYGSVKDFLYRALWLNDDKILALKEKYLI